LTESGDSSKQKAALLKSRSLKRDCPRRARMAFFICSESIEEEFDSTRTFRKPENLEVNDGYE
jgi:hypothetical protein